MIYSLYALLKVVSGISLHPDYFNSHFDSNRAKNVIKGTDKYVQIQFNHRIAFVKAADVTVK